MSNRREQVFAEAEAPLEKVRAIALPTKWRNTQKHGFVRSWFVSFSSGAIAIRGPRNRVLSKGRSFWALLHEKPV